MSSSCEIADVHSKITTSKLCETQWAADEIPVKPAPKRPREVGSVAHIVARPRRQELVFECNVPTTAILPNGFFNLSLFGTG